MNHLPIGVRRQAVPLQKNTTPLVNLMRLCFGLSTNPGAGVLEQAAPCSLEDLRGPPESINNEQNNQPSNEVQSDQPSNEVQSGQPSSEGQSYQPSSFVQGSQEKIYKTDSPTAGLLTQEEEEREFYSEHIYALGKHSSQIVPVLSYCAGRD